MPRVLWFVPIVLILFLLLQPMFGGSKDGGYGKSWCGWPTSQLYRVQESDGSSASEIIGNLAERRDVPGWGIRACNLLIPGFDQLYSGAWIVIPNRLGLYALMAWIVTSTFIIFMAWLTRDQ
ncbi:hypothetical protein A3D08_02245 [Candidatus Roizmanbacteria bacterium RIFCSPHIGHO2_02_FULL_43_11]|uniref:Uncharacterized protein n=1 Tax=Candidatus Roizmanbacteria bacterium RIFCSPHIGHO2_02_FULL_43_11 TaxID=1802043 RepID=A0A1F7HJF0_9BACT|nr:MAG: hypothetical protein A3D08_02245 [Candidatus Roizmanbacteria bacterium RIFCSPHIGHO2_02_FULL_43_11]